MPRKNIRVFYLSLKFTFLSVIWCTAQNKTKVEIKKLNITFIMADTIINNRGVADSVEVNIYNVGKLKIYEFPLIMHLNEYRSSEGQRSWDSTSYSYYVYQPATDSGYYIRNIDENFEAKIPADSIFPQMAFYGGKGWPVDSSLNEILNKLVLVKQISNKRVYQYAFTEGPYDSAHFTLNDDFLNENFIFIKGIDSMFKSRLTKFELFIHHDSKYDSIPSLKNFFVTSYEMKKEEINNEDQILSLYNRFILFENKK